MATTVSELQVVVSADTSKAESGLGALGSKLGSVGAGLATAFGAAAVAGIAGVGAALVSSTTKFAGFQAQMNILKVTAGATDDQMSMLSQRARELGADLELPSTSSAGAATAMLELAKAGLNVDQTMAAAKGTLQLAAAASIDEAKAAQLTAGALNAFGLSGDKATLIANQLAYAANASALDATDLGQAVSQAGFIFKATGRPMEELLASMIVLGNAGLSGSDGATALKNALMQASNPTDAAMKTMKAYGISLFDAQGHMKPVPTLIDHLNDRLGGLTEQQRNAALATIFQSDGMKALIPLMGAGGEQLRKYIEDLKTTNAANDQAKARAEGLVGAWKGLTSQWETAQETIGSKLAPGIEELIRSVAEGIGDLTPTLGAVGEQIGTALADGVKQAKDTLRQLGDAWRTVKQVFENDWQPDASIEPIALAAGNAAVKVRELVDAAKDVAEAVKQAANQAGQMGAWENFSSGMQTLGAEIQLTRDNLDRIGAALARLDSAAGGANSKISALAVTIKGVAVAFELWATSLGQIIDTLALFGKQAAEGAALTLNMGKVLYGLATGDMPMAEAAAKGAAEGLMAMITNQKEWNDRTAERAKQAYAAVAGAAGTEMPKAAAAVESNMSAASQAVGENSAGMQRFMEENGAGMATAAQTAGQQVATGVETGMTQAVAAVEGQGAAAVTAAETMGAGMASGIEAAAPAMAAAAELGASQAVAAVEGQTGAASAAGSSVGANLGDGLISGIQSKLGGIIAAARSMINAALGAANDEAIIESPSKKTMYMGQMLDEGLVKGIQGGGPAVQAAFRDIMAAVTDYVPVAKEIARVENEIKGIRDKAQTEALFRAKEMVTIDSESLRLKQAAVRLERDLIPLRQDLARATREVADIERGSLTDRTNLIEMDGKRKALRLQQIELEKELVGLDADSKRAASIQKQIDRLRDQDRLLALESERISVTNSVAATNARIRKEALDDQARGQDAVISLIKDQIDVLGGEQAVFQANENIIKNATENEIAYRNQLIAVFKSEAAPLQDRITAGLALIDQLEAEGKIGEEVAKAWREVVKQQIEVKASTAGVGAASAAASPAISAATRQAEEAAKAYQKMAEKVDDASGEVDSLAKSLGKLPSWFTPKGGSNVSSVLFPPGRAAGGDVTARQTYLVGENGPELFMPGQSGAIIPNNRLASAVLPASNGGGQAAAGGYDTLEVRLKIGDQEAGRLFVTGYQVAVQERGLLPKGAL